jgi:hypothetical protein
MEAEKILCIADLEAAASKILPASTRGKRALSYQIILSGVQ